MHRPESETAKRKRQNREAQARCRLKAKLRDERNEGTTTTKYNGRILAKLIGAGCLPNKSYYTDREIGEAMFRYMDD